MKKLGVSLASKDRSDAIFIFNFNLGEQRTKAAVMPDYFFKTLGENSMSFLSCFPLAFSMFVQAFFKLFRECANKVVVAPSVCVPT
jgi:hypothetical protein